VSKQRRRQVSLGRVTGQRAPGPAATTSAPSRPARPEKARTGYVGRPFAGLASEPDWVALRELVPAATAPVRLAPSLVATSGVETVTLATVLAMAAPAQVRPDRTVLLGLQRDTRTGDASRELAATLVAALETEPGAAVRVPPPAGDGPRMQDLVADGALDVTVRADFDFWLDGPADSEVRASLERANASVFPTVKLAAAPAAYWCRVPGKAHVRWVLAEDEDDAMAGLARLAARGGLTLGDGTRFAGNFRAHGLLVPVWDLPEGTEADAWEEPLGELRQRYTQALTGGRELDAAERRARHGLIGRQLTLR
jgi:hypothetical protein